MSLFTIISITITPTHYLSSITITIASSLSLQYIRSSTFYKWNSLSIIFQLLKKLQVWHIRSSTFYKWNSLSIVFQLLNKLLVWSSIYCWWLLEEVVVVDCGAGGSDGDVLKEEQVWVPCSIYRMACCFRFAVVIDCGTSLQYVQI